MEGYQLIGSLLALLVIVTSAVMFFDFICMKELTRLRDAHFEILRENSLKNLERLSNFQYENGDFVYREKKHLSLVK